MRGEPVERIPTMPQICHDTAVRIYEEDWIAGMMRCQEQPALIHDYVIRLARQTGCDGLRLWRLGEPINAVRDGDQVFQVDPATGERIGKSDLHGGGWIVPFRPEPPIETLDDARKAVRALRYTDEQIEQITRARARVPDLFVASNSVGLTMDTYTALRGRENAYLDLLERPAYVHAVFEMILEVSLENAERMACIGLDAFLIGDPAASASLISPRHFERFCVPYYRRYCQHFAGRDTLIYMHVCGNSAPILEMMADTGVHCIEPLDTLAGVSVADAKRRVGHRVVLMGGVNTLLLAQGTPDEVTAEAIRCCREGGPDRYILAAADMVPPATPLANLQAMVDVARKSLWK